jgi:hypothetical protein
VVYWIARRARNPEVPGSIPGLVATSDMRYILGQDVHSHLLRSTKPSILSGSVNWYQFRLGVNVLSCGYRDDGCRLQRWFTIDDCAAFLRRSYL